MKLAREPSSRAGPRLIAHHVGHVRTANQRPAKNHSKAHRKAHVSKSIEFFRGYETAHRKIPARGPQVLADRRNVDTRSAEIAEQLMDFFSGLAETNHKSR